MITAKQCQAGRRLLKMTENELSIASGVSLEAIVGFESGKRLLNDFSQQALRHAFEAGGAVLVEDDARLSGGDLRGITKDPRDEGFGGELE